MPDPILDFDYIEFDGERAAAVTRPVIAETPWALYVEKREWVTFMCSPIGLHQLALGFLLSEGVIGGLEMCGSSRSIWTKTGCICTSPRPA